ncbi:MAG: class I SAM-dependent methyltransferase, partial [Pseudolabrys sp.]|nr:class I SAM-dependent methyltransferase [Pseudolabrys sp.]
MDRLLQFVLSRFIRKGSFRLITSRGTTFQFGDGTGTPVTVRFSTRALEWAILKDPELKFGEGFMDGSVVIEQGTIADVLKIVMSQSTGVGGGESPQWSKIQFLLRYLRRRLAQFNSRRRSQRNVAHHYDLDGRLYSLFLDADEQYSCAYFEHPEQSLDDAQLAKKRHLAAKLLIPDGARVLDIGCGWGGLGLYLAEMTNAKVTGITLSKEQYGIANARAAERGLSDRAQFRLVDYRDVTEKFDRIVSVGMFEH